MAPASNQAQCRQSTPHSAAQSGTAELTINIVERGYDAWIGTSAQLVAEGLIPEDFSWPFAAEDVRWEADGFDFWLRRRRPDGFKGPMKAWLEVDNWYVRRSPISQGRDCLTAAMIHEKRRALADALWRQSPASDEQFNRYCKSTQDKRFQAFKSLVPGLGAKRKSAKQGAQQ